MPQERTSAIYQRDWGHAIASGSTRGASSRHRMGDLRQRVVNGRLVFAWYRVVARFLRLFTPEASTHMDDCEWTDCELMLVNGRL